MSSVLIFLSLGILCVVMLLVLGCRLSIECGVIVMFVLVVMYVMIV